VNRRKGFTLVELLVVIAIIALLMGILMPALAKVRRQARATACMVQVKQWATTMSMYTNDWDGYFFSDYQYINNAWRRTLFTEKLQGYYKNTKLALCQSAKKTRDEGGRVPNSAWRYELPYSTKNTKNNETGRYYKGSYAVNQWFGDMEKDQKEQYKRTKVRRWKNVGIMRQPSLVPLIGDVCDDGRAFPLADTKPPALIDTSGVDDASPNATSKLMNFCIRRHGPESNPNINMGFGDFSVRAVGLKELWSLNWHRQWVAERKELQPVVDWEAGDGWMKGFSDKGYIEY